MTIHGTLFGTREIRMIAGPRMHSGQQVQTRGKVIDSGEARRHRIRHLAGRLSRSATRKYQAPRCQGVHRAQDVRFQAKCNLMAGGFHVVLPFFPVKQSSFMGWNGFLACGCTPNHGLKLWNLGKVPKNHRKLPQSLGKFSLHSGMFSAKKPCFLSNESPWARNPGGMPKTSPAPPQNHGYAPGDWGRSPPPPG